MSKFNALETALLNLIFRGIALPGDFGGTLYLALHEGDPGEAGNQSTNETAYGGYARVAVARDNTASAFTVTGDTAANALTAVFPVSTTGPHVLTHWSIGTAASGSGGTPCYKFPIVNGAGDPISVTINPNSEPRFNAGEITVQES